MCSVVEIKNESEYYITYHSPESLETVTSQQQSLEYQHLFRLRQPDEDDESDDVSSDPNATDKDFSVEEIVTPRNGLSSSTNDNDHNDSGGETPKALNEEEEVANGSDQEHVVDNDLPVDNELNCEKAPGDIKTVDQTLIENNLPSDVNIKGAFCNTWLHEFLYYENQSLFVHKKSYNLIPSYVILLLETNTMNHRRDF